MLYEKLTLAYAMASVVVATSKSRVVLPAPTGHFEVGLSITELVDNSKTQPFAPTVQPRRLMVSIFYPVTPHHELCLGEYMPPETAIYEDVEQLSLTGLDSPNGTFEKLVYHVSSDVPAQHNAHREHEFPLVLFQPAEGTTRHFYNLIASTIASNGFIIASIDIPYDVDLVEYPDGSIVTLNAADADETNLTQLAINAEIAVKTRAEDSSFVLDSLSNVTLAHSLIPNLPSTGLNTTHVPMFGHSVGGAASLPALSDDRIIAGLDMDGATWRPSIKTGTTKPFMIMAHENSTRAVADPYQSWVHTWPNLKGWKRDIIISGAGHYDFSDFPIVLETLGIKPNATVNDLLHLGSLEGHRALKIVTTYVTAFLEFVLFGTCAPLLDGPSAQFPEVAFEY